MHRFSCPRILSRLTLAWLVLAGATVAFAQKQLPSEAELPARTPKAELPSESLLPGQSPGGPGRALPSERALPVALQDDPPEAPNQDAGPRVWLRLSLPGHTAPVRTLAFTRDAARLWSGGEDKEAHLWQAAPAGRQPWLHQGVARWDVTRSALSGRIYALAAAPGWVAMGGSRAYGNRGDILLFDPASGKRVAVLGRAEDGHQRTITALAFSNDGQRLASADEDGRLLLWTRDAASGVWSHQEINPTDQQAGLSLPANARNFFPIAWRDNQHLLVPKHLGAEAVQGRSYLKWAIEEIDVAAKTRRLLPLRGKLGVHWNGVTAIAAAADGRRVFTADKTGLMYAWDLEKGALTPTSHDRMVTALASSPTGERLLVGLDTMKGQAQGRVEWWSVPESGAPRREQSRATTGTTYAVAISLDGQQAAYADSAQVRIGGPRSPLEDWYASDIQAAPPTDVVFEKADGDEYRLGVAFGPDAPRLVFDPQQLQLEASDASAPIAPAAAYQGDWELDVVADEAGRYFLKRDGKRMAYLPWTGAAARPRSWCWTPDQQGRPFAIAVNVSSDGVIHVLRLAEEGPAPVIRRFRGHQSSIHAMSLAPDRRYLATASQDRSVGLWKVEGLAEAEPSINLWGAKWQADERVVAAVEVADDGPLFHRDIRSGDQLQRITWFEVEGETQQEATTPADIMAVLSRTDELMPTFYFRRNQNALPPMQMHSAWNATANFFVAPQQREWAYWTPRGYYDASFNGHKLFGWQVNRDRDTDPEFFLAARFRERLERPGLMSRLLREGSLQRALDSAAANASQASADVSALAANQPRIEILAPAADAVADGDNIKVRVRISTPAGQQLAPPKVFANGVAAGPGRLVAEQRLADGGPFAQQYEYQWTAPLPNDASIRLQVLAATTDEAVAAAERTLPRTLKSPRRQPRLFLISAGVSRYREGIPRLDYAAHNADAFGAALASGAAALYKTNDLLLQDEAVTGPMWRVLSQQTAEDLREDVTPDDLLVFYLSGHGVRDEATNQYYYLGANARFADVVAGKYQDCLSFADFANFADLPCRKLAILDTCHSGAVQQLRQRHLKSALRSLQDDLVLTLTASEGHEEAFEIPALQMGQFTYHLVQALQGKADLEGDQDGIVTLAEAANYVQYHVPADAPNKTIQHPTFGPSELKDLVQIPLVKGW